jgi:hypothetical protein
LKGDRECLWLIEVHHILLMLRLAGEFLATGADLAAVEDTHGTASRCFVRVRPGPHFSSPS